MKSTSEKRPEFFQTFYVAPVGTEKFAAMKGGAAIGRRQIALCDTTGAKPRVNVLLRAAHACAGLLRSCVGFLAAHVIGEKTSVLETRLHRRLGDFFNCTQNQLSPTCWNKLARAAVDLSERLGPGNTPKKLVLDAFKNQWPLADEAPLAALDKIKRLLSFMDSPGVNSILNRTNNECQIQHVKTLVVALREKTEVQFERAFKAMKAEITLEHLPVLHECAHSLRQLGHDNLAESVVKKTDEVTRECLGEVVDGLKDCRKNGQTLDPSVKPSCLNDLRQCLHRLDKLTAQKKIEDFILDAVSDQSSEQIHRLYNVIVVGNSPSSGVGSVDAAIQSGAGQLSATVSSIAILQWLQCGLMVAQEHAFEKEIRQQELEDSKKAQALAEVKAQQAQDARKKLVAQAEEAARVTQAEQKSEASNQRKLAKQIRRAEMAHADLVRHTTEKLGAFLCHLNVNGKISHYKPFQALLDLKHLTQHCAVNQAEQLLRMTFDAAVATFSQDQKRHIASYLDSAHQDYFSELVTKHDDNPASDSCTAVQIVDLVKSLVKEKFGSPATTQKAAMVSLLPVQASPVPGTSLVSEIAQFLQPSEGETKNTDKNFAHLSEIAKLINGVDDNRRAETLRQHIVSALVAIPHDAVVSIYRRLVNTHERDQGLWALVEAGKDGGEISPAFASGFSAATVHDCICRVLFEEIRNVELSKFRARKAN